MLRVGDDPAALSYLRQITRAFERHGLTVEARALPAGSAQADVGAALAELAATPSVHGILLQLPLPGGLQAEPLIEALPLAKDVEGLHPYHVGRLALGRAAIAPSTPLAGLEILRAAGYSPAGRLAVVVGRSAVVGRPLASLLLQADATVVICHSRTPDLGALTRQADILCAAAGRPGLIRGEMIKPGAIVLDFGTNEVDGRLVGDVDMDAAATRAAAITPVPGGVGPVTTAVLARNLLQLAVGDH